MTKTLMIDFDSKYNEAFLAIEDALLEAGIIFDMYWGSEDV